MLTIYLGQNSPRLSCEKCKRPVWSTLRPLVGNLEYPLQGSYVSDAI